MTREEAKTVAYLFTMLGRCVAERTALISIAEDAGIREVEAALQKYRNSPDYQLQVRKFELLATRLEIDRTAEALAQLMQLLSGGKPEN